MRIVEDNRANLSQGECSLVKIAQRPQALFLPQVFVTSGEATISYGFFRQMALSVGRSWPCSSYAAVTST